MRQTPPERINLNEIRFEKRDPEKIGNGLHDYDIYHEDFYMGIISFVPGQAGPQNAPVSVIFGDLKIGGIRYNIPMSTEQIRAMPSNEKVFHEVRPMILQCWRAYQDN